MTEAPCRCLPSGGEAIDPAPLPSLRPASIAFPSLELVDPCFPGLPDRLLALLDLILRNVKCSAPGLVMWRLIVN